MKRVLIVDNNVKVANSLKDLLEGRGYGCSVRNTGVAALLELGRTVVSEEASLYDLLVIDLGGLGDILGSTLVGKIRGFFNKDVETMRRDVYVYFYPVFRMEAEKTYRLIHENYSSTPIIGISKRPERKDCRKYKVYHIIKVFEETNTVDEGSLFKAIEELLSSCD